MEKSKKLEIHQSVINNQKIKVFEILNKNKPDEKKLKPTISAYNTPILENQTNQINTNI